jgi:tRNA G18 (ribose-2'-O)-methylase SpoU
MIVALCNIRSAHNVGSIFRTADALGVEKLYLCGITPQPGQPGKSGRELAKTALGAEHSVPWERARRAGDVIRKLRTQGFQIVGLEQDKHSCNIFSFRMPKTKQKLLLLLGAEIGGIPRPLLEKCDRVIEIPMYGQKESLNVSVAFGVAAYIIKQGNHKTQYAN